MKHGVRASVEVTSPSADSAPSLVSRPSSIAAGTPARWLMPPLPTPTQGQAVGSLPRLQR